jgi:branched-chain amino acid transport system substrate-binding protein
MLSVVELAVADASRGAVELEVAAVDDQADEGVAATVAGQLCADPSVIAVVGHKNSGPSRAGAPVYATAGLAQLTQCSTDNSLSRSGWRTFFRLCADNERQAAVAADFARSRVEAARVVAVHDGTDYGRPLVEAFAAQVRAKGGEKALVLAMHVGQSDFNEIVAAVRAFDAELVYIGATEVEGSKLTIALRAAGVAAHVLTSEGGPHNPFPRLAGPAAEGSVHTYAGADPSSTPAARRLAERCAREFGEAPSFMVECYDAVTAVAAALAGGHCTRGEVRDAIAQTDIEGLAGRIRFDPNGDRIEAPVSLWRVESGRMIPLESSLPRKAGRWREAPDGAVQ